VLERALGEDAGLHEAYIPQSPLRKNARQVRLPLGPARAWTATAILSHPL